MGRALSSFSFFIGTLALLSVVNGKPSPAPIEIDSSNVDKIFQDEWMVMFYAPWCPACKAVKPIWKSFSEQWSEEFKVKIGQVDMEENPGLSGQFLVFSLPSMFHIKDGEVRYYTGLKNSEAFMNYLNDKQWKNENPVEWWKSPNSIQMRAVAGFFTLSNMIKELHDVLLDEYQLPTWAVYGLFAICTIIIGLVLGMMLVCCCDLICPPKYQTPAVVKPVDRSQYTPVQPRSSVKQDKKKTAKEPEKVSDAEGSGSEKEAAAAGGEASAAEPTSEGKVRKRKPRKD